MSQYQAAQEVTETKLVSARHGSKTGRVRYQSDVAFLEVFSVRSGAKGCVSVSWKDIPQQLAEHKVASKKSLLTPCFHGEKTLNRGIRATLSPDSGPGPTETDFVTVTSCAR